MVESTEMSCEQPQDAARCDTPNPQPVIHSEIEDMGLASHEVKPHLKARFNDDEVPHRDVETGSPWTTAQPRWSANSEKEEEKDNASPLYASPLTTLSRAKSWSCSRQMEARQREKSMQDPDSEMRVREDSMRQREGSKRSLKGVGSAVRDREGSVVSVVFQKGKSKIVNGEVCPIFADSRRVWWRTMNALQSWPRFCVQPAL